MKVVTAGYSSREIVVGKNFLLPMALNAIVEGPGPGDAFTS
jgi:hypothetical protein